MEKGRRLKQALLAEASAYPATQQHGLLTERWLTPLQGAAADAGRRWPEGEPRKHKRSRSEREREDAEDGERSKRHYRRKDTDEAPPDYRYKVPPCVCESAYYGPG